MLLLLLLLLLPVCCRPQRLSFRSHRPSTRRSPIASAGCTVVPNPQKDLVRLQQRLRAPIAAMAAPLRQLVVEEFKPIVLVSASPAANAALERNKLSFEQLFAPHADAPLPAGSGREGSPYVKYDGPLTVRFVACANYTESEQEAEASLVTALTHHNDVILSCDLCFSLRRH